ncbi:unnamed protein product [Sphacelaria rigidula]
MSSQNSAVHERRSSWTCDSVTISYASARGTARCRRCKQYLAEGELRFGMIFKSQNPTTHMLYQGFHLCCVAAPDNVTCPEDLEGIQDLMPQDVEMVRRWIQTGIAPPPVLSLPGAKGSNPGMAGHMAHGVTAP